MPHKKSVKQLNDDVHRFLKDDDYEKAISALRNGLQASHVVRKNREDGERGINYEDVPDHTTRMHAAKLLLEYGFGKPATRTEISIEDNTQKTAAPAEILSRLRSSGTQLAEIMDTYSNSMRQAEIVRPMELENDE